MKKRTIDDYRVIVGWSAERQRYLARVPAFRGLLADGATEEEALTEARIALGGMLAVLETDGEDAPAPDQPLEQVRASGQGFSRRIRAASHDLRRERLLDEADAAFNEAIATLNKPPCKRRQSPPAC
ncbi:putative RNase H-like HicB family nuclease [Ereboglobus sp. PH5-10]|uniref:type II toxin-antitoxin system HicB family antitoxin n=1 Tax=Ereboglobus sp. PH5-10 TaxID=2940629 RepID=UPI002406DD26|nr:hypothetical protein [Ereboglobus sp. PH5-10]MDF9827923.1 putative RNase H-like HicB family nuclease [Ereboglobus sp. PH5-10]